MNTPHTTPAGWTLSRTPQGALQLTTADGQTHTGITPVRAFPLAAPDEGISLVGSDGAERLWIPRLSALEDSARALIEESLAPREFMPRIQRIVAVSGYATPSTWTLETDRGPAHLVLKAEEDIRRLGNGRLLITDRHGLQFEVRDLSALDRGSRRILNRFM